MTKDQATAELMQMMSLNKFLVGKLHTLLRMHMLYVHFKAVWDGTMQL